MLIDSANKQNKLADEAPKEGPKHIKLKNLGMGVVQITYNIKEEGFYMMVFGDKLSWIKPKTLRYKYSVLVPTNSESMQPPKEGEVD